MITMIASFPELGRKPIVIGEIAPTRRQYDELEAASHLAVLEEPRSASATDGSLALTFALPRQAVSLVMIEWE